MVRTGYSEPNDKRKTVYKYFCKSNYIRKLTHSWEANSHTGKKFTLFYETVQTKAEH
jgi:hypothetical protein